MPSHSMSGTHLHLEHRLEVYFTLKLHFRHKVRLNLDLTLTPKLEFRLIIKPKPRVTPQMHHPLLPPPPNPTIATQLRREAVFGCSKAAKRLSRPQSRSPGSSCVREAGEWGGGG